VLKKRGINQQVIKILTKKDINHYQKGYKSHDDASDKNPYQKGYKSLDEASDKILIQMDTNHINVQMI